MGFKYSVFTSKGLKRESNEDAAATYEVANGLLSVVCDGLSSNRGALASELISKSVYEFFIKFDGTDYLHRITESIRRSNEILFERLTREEEDIKGFATTIEVLFLTNNSIYWAHLGDSRLYHLKNGKLKQLTKDHSLVQHLIDRGMVSYKDLKNHPGKNTLIKAINDKVLAISDISKAKLNENDENKFFLCSDGVTEVLSNKKIESLLNNHSVSNLPAVLSREVDKRGAPDNYSFVAIEYLK